MFHTAILPIIIKNYYQQKPEIVILGYPNVQETNAAGLSDLPEGVIEYNLCPYLSDRDITKMTYLKNCYLEQIFTRIQSQRDEKCKYLSRNDYSIFLWIRNLNFISC